MNGQHFHGTGTAGRSVGGERPLKGLGLSYALPRGTGHTRRLGKNPGTARRSEALTVSKAGTARTAIRSTNSSRPNPGRKSACKRRDWTAHSMDWREEKAGLPDSRAFERNSSDCFDQTACEYSRPPPRLVRASGRGHLDKP